MTLQPELAAPDTYIHLDEQHGAHNYHPMPVVLERGSGVKVWDVEGKEYFDFLSGYSALNQGHCHPRLLRVITEQASKLTLTSRAFHHSLFGKFCKKITELFQYDKVLPMNTGVEAVETSIKLARRWGYQVKKVPEGQAVMVVCHQNFHGRTSTVISFSSDENAKGGFGPYATGFISIPFNDIEALTTAVQNKNVVAFLVEPIQGEAGVVIPADGYLQMAYNICRQHKVLFIADEIQTGIGRTGKMLACDHENVHPDILLLGKALGGGVLPVSAVLADDEIMLTIQPGQHGSTFGGNPLACAVAMEALDIVIEEDLASNAHKMGEMFRERFRGSDQKHLKEIRGKGLLNAVELRSGDENDAMKLALRFMQNGLLAKPTQGTKIRLSPPLVINAQEMDSALRIIMQSFEVLD